MSESNPIKTELDFARSLKGLANSRIFRIAICCYSLFVVTSILETHAGLITNAVLSLMDRASYLFFAVALISFSYLLYRFSQMVIDGNDRAFEGFEVE